MKYSNSFFVFHMVPAAEDNEYINDYNDPESVQILKFGGVYEQFKFYDFALLNQSSRSYRLQYIEIPIWIDEYRNIVILFMENELLLPLVTRELEKKLRVSLMPYALKEEAKNFNNGNILFTKKGLYDVFNGVMTTLLKNDHQRTKAIELVL